MFQIVNFGRKLVFRVLVLFADILRIKSRSNRFVSISKNCDLGNLYSVIMDQFQVMVLYSRNQKEYLECTKQPTFPSFIGFFFFFKLILA